MKIEEQLKINGSGLFFFKSDLLDSEQLQIFDWYNALPANQKIFVDHLRNEASVEAEFFAQQD